MKKLLSMILALAMVLALSTTVFAADLQTSEINGQQSTEVKANYQPAGEPTFIEAKVYYVKVEWKQEGTLKYSEGSTTYKWNAEQNRYEEDDNATTGAGWTVDNAYVKVTVTNQSNAKINASFTAEPKSGITINGTFDQPAVGLESAAPQNPSAANLNGSNVQSTITYTINSVTGTISANDTAIATLTVTLTHD